MSTPEYAIYPAIGIARVGTSEEFYISPETANALPENLDGSPFTAKDFRDGEQKLKRQAARFTVHKVNDDGTTRPITLDDNDIECITWEVHLANKKSIWYEFQTNLGEDGYASNHPLRNASVTEESERQKMIIDPGPKMVDAPNKVMKFNRKGIENPDHQHFPPKELKPFSIETLGEMKMTDSGELLVVGGHGNSGTTQETPKIETYANNDDWYDDTSDGPVKATIKFKKEDGETIEINATPAWVICGPPSYAPEIGNLVTLYDTIFDAAVRTMNFKPEIYEDGLWKRGKDGFQPHFETHIQPILERGQTYPWVVAIPPKPHRFDISRLGDNSEGMRGLRERILDYLRAPNDINTLVDSNSGNTMMPYLAGDSAIGDDADSKFLRLTETQYFFLQQWSEGYFTSGKENAPKQSEGDCITQGVLENCVGGAFSPGIEMTWVSRLTQIYSEPFRIKPKHDIPSPLSLGWNPEKGLEPGDVTKFMAIPWQADFNECSSQPVNGRTVWWWPAQRPLFVYIKNKENVNKENVDSNKTMIKMILDGDIKQVPWIGTDYDMGADNFIKFSDDVEMVEKWMDLGMIINEGTSEMPMFVEVERTQQRTES